MILAALHPALFAAAIAAAIAAAQPAPPGPPAPPTVEPTLDELLGLPAAKPSQPSPPADVGPVPPAPVDPAKADLDRDLAGGDVSDDFERAVGLMGQTAARLRLARDAGIDTQRLQEETLRRLDKLLDDAAKQQQQKSKSKKQKKPGSQDEQQRENQQQQQSSQAQAQAGDPNRATPGPARRDGTLNPPQAGNAAAWGALPEHVRDALTEGLSDRFSSIYKSMTEQYYKRLAEEPKPGAGESGGPR